MTLAVVVLVTIHGKRDSEGSNYWPVTNEWMNWRDVCKLGKLSIFELVYVHDFRIYSFVLKKWLVKIFVNISYNATYVRNYKCHPA